ncbi:hypothetical protein [Actinoplanes sp. NPDC051494]|uniref:hypothetical protein n=1 Tax=Actinoplanes sp. NPDC051494 TaxID=3363907 RepID=UPI00379620C0
MTDELQDLQENAGRIGEAFTHHDAKALAGLTPEERAIQTEMRWRLHQYVSGIWDAPNEGPDGRHAVDVGGYGGVGALLDLLMLLWANAKEAQYKAGEDPDADIVEITVEHDE